MGSPVPLVPPLSLAAIVLCTGWKEREVGERGMPKTRASNDYLGGTRHLKNCS